MRVERELSAGELTARRVYDASGDMLQEERYAAGAVAQKSLFTYTGGHLSGYGCLPQMERHVPEEYVYAAGEVSARSCEPARTATSSTPLTSRHGRAGGGAQTRPGSFFHYPL